MGWEEFPAGYSGHHPHKLAADQLVGLNDSSSAVGVYRVNTGDGSRKIPEYFAAIYGLVKWQVKLA